MTVSSTTTAGAATAATASTAKSGTTLASLSGNFQDFLKLLMTQLQNQDPTSPMDTNQFTSQLVQFASVEQQINTNSSLNKLIEATQGNEVLQSSSMLGKRAQVASDHLTLQNGTAAVRFDTTASQPVSIGVYSDTGAKLRDVTVTSTAGTNTWTWDGKDNTGNTVRDGSYRTMVVDSVGTAVPFTILGTVTGMQRTGDTVNVQLGSLKTRFSAVQSVDIAN